jgi:glycosyltransferase 2 family protein
VPWLARLRTASSVSGARSFVLRLAMGVGILGLVLLLVDVSDVWTVLAGLDLWLVLLAFAFLLSTRVLVGLKWWLLLGGRSAAVSYPVVQRAIFLADYQALLFPNTLAVDAMRLVLLRHHPRGMTYMAATILADRVVNVMVAAGLALLGMLLVQVLPIGAAIEPAALGIVVGTALALLAAGAALLSPPLFALVMLVLERVLAHGPLRRPTMAIAAKARQLHSAMTTVLTHPETLRKVIGISVLVTLARAAHVYCLFASLGALLAVLPMLAVYPIIMLFVLLPISLLGIGVQDGAFIFFFGSLGVPPSTALAASLASYATVLASCIVSGIIAALVGPKMPIAEQGRTVR